MTILPFNLYKTCGLHENKIKKYNTCHNPNQNKYGTFFSFHHSYAKLNFIDSLCPCISYESYIPCVYPSKQKGPRWITGKDAKRTITNNQRINRIENQLRVGVANEPSRGLLETRYFSVTQIIMHVFLL